MNSNNNFYNNIKPENKIGNNFYKPNNNFMSIEDLENLESQQINPLECETKLVKISDVKDKELIRHF